MFFEHDTRLVDAPHAFERFRPDYRGRDPFVPALAGSPMGH